MRKAIRNKATAVGLPASCLLVTARNTVAGAGKGTSDLGHDINHGADNAKPQ
jgi:predicted small secreted protein